MRQLAIAIALEIVYADHCGLCRRAAILPLRRRDFATRFDDEMAARNPPLAIVRAWGLAARWLEDGLAIGLLPQEVSIARDADERTAMAGLYRELDA